MAQQQREQEDTDLKVPETLSSCTQSIQLSPPHLDESRPSVRLMDTPDLKLSTTDDSRSTSPGSDLVFVPTKALKRKRESQGNRCSCLGCKKKLGLMGFRCRCGEMFCPEHRYSDRHSCSFDYKAAGREAIARENPVVRAAKLLKV